MAETVGNSFAIVRGRRRSYQYQSPYEREIDIDLASYASMFGAFNTKDSNIYIEPTVGAAIVKPLLINRSNYVITTQMDMDSWNPNWTTEVPRGYVNELTTTSSETQYEVLKRVWRSYPNEWQLARDILDSGVLRGGYSEPWISNPFAQYWHNVESPKWSSELRFPIFMDYDTLQGTNINNISWVHQQNTDPNCEWFLAQEYGNFQNESFFIDLIKYQKAGEPGSIPGEKDLKYRYTVYKDGEFASTNDVKEIHAYFAIRVGWKNARNKLQDLKEKKEKSFDGLYPVFNSEDVEVGPYDIVFPIDGMPFIYDHQGDAIAPLNQETGSVEVNNLEPYRYTGFVASDAPDSSWILRDDVSHTRIVFYILRGKLILYASHAPDKPWVFPLNISTKVSQRTQERYSNFYIPAGNVCILGRGFRFLFSYNPMEFDIMKNGEDREKLDGCHAKVAFYPMMERQIYPDGNFGGWRDIYQTHLTEFIDNGKDGEHNFMILPLDGEKKVEDRNVADAPIVYNFGCDISSNKAYAYHSSMMIGLDCKDVRAVPSGLKSKAVNPRTLVNAYLRAPTVYESAAENDPIGSQYGFETHLTSGQADFLTKIPLVELRCRRPSYKSDSPTNGENTYMISRRFASPVFWRFKAFHRVPTTIRPDWIDLSSLVLNLSYDFTCTDYITMKKTAQIQLLFPKAHEVAEYITETQINTRKKLKAWFDKGNFEIEIWMGWFGSSVEEPVLAESNGFGVFSSDETDVGSDFMTASVGGADAKCVRIFTGMARAGQMLQTYVRDTITLECCDYTQILEEQPIILSPIYDGNTSANAFLHVCQLNGIPHDMFDVVSVSAWIEALPMGYTFQEPKIKFPKNTSLLAAAKQIAQYFQHVIIPYPNGRIVLGDIFHSVPGAQDDSLYIGALKSIDELPLTHSSYVFYVDGYRDEIGGGGYCPNPWQRLYDQFNSTRSINEQMSQLLIVSVDRNDGALINDGTVMDVASIENPTTSGNFVGYSKPVKVDDPAFGDIQHINAFKRLMAKRIFTPPLSVRFSIYGRPTLRPLDIIGVYHSEDMGIKEILVDKGVQFLSGSGYNDSDNYVQYRISSVKGTLQYDEARYQYKIDVEGIRI